jgi:hypothetical protein
VSDIPYPIPAELPVRSLWRVACVAALLAAVLVAALVSIKVEECRTIPGAFSSGFSLGFDVSRKVCGQSTLAIVMAHKALDAMQAAIVAATRCDDPSDPLTKRRPVGLLRSTLPLALDTTYPDFITDPQPAFLLEHHNRCLPGSVFSIGRADGGDFLASAEQGHHPG